MPVKKKTKSQARRIAVQKKVHSHAGGTDHGPNCTGFSDAGLLKNLAEFGRNIQKSEHGLAILIAHSHEKSKTSYDQATVAVKHMTRESVAAALIQIMESQGITIPTLTMVKAMMLAEDARKGRKPKK